MNSEHIWVIPYNVAMLWPDIGSGRTLASEILKFEIPHTLKVWRSQ